MNLATMSERIFQNMARRQRLGWLDYSSGSYDRHIAAARAWRILERLRGRRMTLAQALREY